MHQNNNGAGLVHKELDGQSSKPYRVDGRVALHLIDHSASLMACPQIAFPVGVEVESRDGNVENEMKESSFYLKPFPKRTLHRYLTTIRN